MWYDPWYFATSLAKRPFVLQEVYFEDQETAVQAQPKGSTLRIIFRHCVLVFPRENSIQGLAVNDQ
ncbi:hypothetical protein MTO96_028283, partial [Rhipicephalus appendiculatus]